MTIHVKWTREDWGGGEGRGIEGEEMDQGRLGRRGGKGNRR